MAVMKRRGQETQRFVPLRHPLAVTYTLGHYHYIYLIE